MNILTLSIGRRILESGSKDRARMRLYAEQARSLHIIVLTRRKHGHKDVMHEGNLYIYPTHSYSRILMLIDAFLLGWRILKEQREERFVVSSQDPFEIGFVSYLLAKVGGARFHIQMHGDYFDSLWRGKSPVRVARLLLAHFLLSRACGVRAVSNRIKQSLLRHKISDEKITVLPIRPELEAFLAVPRTHRVGTPLTFITVSRLVHEKNIPLMLRAFERFVRNHIGAQLRIVGSGEEETYIRALITELNLAENVSMIPWTDNVQGEMGKADVFLLASDHEAYALVLVEALAAGLPVVTTDVGCVGEIVLPEMHGIVVPPQDEEAYAVALARIADEPQFREACGARGRATALTLASISPESYAKAWVAAHSCDTDRV